MRDLRVVQQRRVERCRQRERAELASVEAMNRCRPARDVVPLYEQYQDVVDAVPVHAFRRRATFFAHPRRDPELMHLDVPVSRPGEALERGARARQNRRHRPARSDRVVNGCEPACDSPVQRVVVAALVMRLVRSTDNRSAGRRRVDRVTPPAVATTVGHVVIELEIAPAGRERPPVGKRAVRGQQLVHVGGAQEGITVERDCGRQLISAYDRHRTIVLPGARPLRSSRGLDCSSRRTGGFERASHRGATLIHHAADGTGQFLGQQIRDPDNSRPIVAVGKRLDGCVMVGRAPLDDGVRNPSRPIVHVDNPLAGHDAAGESDQPGVALEPRVEHEPPGEARVNRADVPNRIPDVVGRCVDEHFLVN